MTPFLEKFREIVVDTNAEMIIAVLEPLLFERLKQELEKELANTANSLAAVNFEQPVNAFQVIMDGVEVNILAAETTPAFKELEQFL